MMNRRHPLSSTFQSACRDSFRRSARLISSDLFDDTSCQTAGRAQFRAPIAAPTATAAGRRVAKSRGEAERRQTIAERKQAEMAAATAATSKSGTSKPGTTTQAGED